MKKAVLFMMICALLAGCGQKTPSVAADGTAWSEDWVMVGEKIGVEDPGHDFTLRDVKGAKKMYFTAWSIGDAQPHTGADGEEIDVYDAQLVFLLVESGSAESAQATVDEWLALAGETYAVTGTAQQTCNGQEFTLLSYTFASENSAYARGASAFTVYGGCAVSAEFACQDDFDTDPSEMLTDFLEHCHYAAE